jgi:hypothetical protein
MSTDAKETLEDQLSKAKAIVVLTMLAAQGADSNSDGKMEAIYVQNAMDAVIEHLREAQAAVDVLGFKSEGAPQ